MSHHFDSKLARENPGLSICDMYLFSGAPEHTVMAMTVSADVGLSAPDTFPEEGLYAFRFDLDGDAREEVVFKFRFGEPRHVGGDEHVHIQPFHIRRGEGNAIAGDAGTLLLEGETGTVAANGGVRAFVGIKPELWAADAIAFFNFLNALYAEGRFGDDAFLNRTNYFRKRNVMAIVLEVPNALIGRGKVRGWATTSLYGHAPETQVYRWGLPLFTHFYLSDPTAPMLVEKFHETPPSCDLDLFAPSVARFAATLAQKGKSADDPAVHGRRVAARLCPVMLPYELGTEAVFDLAGFNGRPLGQDAYDVMLSLGANRPLADGVAPPIDRIQAEFPYYGEPYSKAEQADLAPISTGFEA
jgi:hypothetical protein